MRIRVARSSNMAELTEHQRSLCNLIPANGPPRQSVPPSRARPAAAPQLAPTTNGASTLKLIPDEADQLRSISDAEGSVNGIQIVIMDKQLSEGINHVIAGLKAGLEEAPGAESTIDETACS